MNTNNQLPLVAYEQAQLLKKAGFDWHTEFCYIPSGKLLSCYSEEFEENGNGYPANFNSCSTDGWCSAPTVAIALKWMRDVKGVMCGIGVSYTKIANRPRYEIVFVRPIGIVGTVDFDTYKAAESALLDELLNIIENNGKNKKN